MLAVVVMALLASAVAVSFAGPLRAARGRQAVDELVALDGAARQTARAQGRAVRMVFDPAEGSASRYAGPARLARVTMPVGFGIRDVLVGRRVTRESKAEVEVSSSGWSRSYAVHVTGEKSDVWVVFAGLGGRPSMVQDEETARSIIAGANASAASGRDAD